MTTPLECDDDGLSLMAQGQQDKEEELKYRQHNKNVQLKWNMLNNNNIKITARTAYRRF